MSVTIDDVEKIALLARLNVTPDEKVRFAEQMNQILEYMEKLNELDTKGVEPLSHPLEMTNVFREDEVQPSLSQQEALANASLKSDKFFRVPKVVKK